MMKVFALVFLALIGAGARCQDVVSLKDGELFYQLIDSVDGSQEQLYSKAKVWLAKNAGSAKSVIQVDNASTGTLVGKGWYPVKTGGLGMATWQCYTTVTIDCREGKFRIQLSDFYYQGEGSDAKHSFEKYINYKGIGKKTAQKFLQDVDHGAKELLASFQSYMKDTSDDF